MYRDCWNVTVQDCGLFISIENGHFSASPDGVVTEPSGDKGIIEVKALPTFSQIDPLQAYSDNKYPVKMTLVNLNGNRQRLPKLKKTHKFYHQIQLQLYCFSHFAQFAEFVILHVDVNKLHYERIYPDQEWKESKIDKMETFYTRKVVDELLQ